MSRYQNYSTEQLVKLFLGKGKEGECWDFKQEWHENMSDLIKDIICFANTVHDENCYIIFGVSDDLRIVGMQKTRRKQAEIIDTISNLNFAGDNYPKVSIDSIKYNGIELDVLIIYDTDKTPIFLKKRYGKMFKGCIYLRNEDKNTQDDGNADICDIENLWRKRLGLTKAPLDYIYDHMDNKFEWTDNEYSFYNIFKPEYSIEIITDENHSNKDEFYSYAMTNESTSFSILNIKYQQTILESFEVVVLDSGRLQIPVPELGFICHDEHGRTPKSYKYYIRENKRFQVLTFLYDQENEDEQCAFKRLKEVVIFYQSDSERVAFEAYIEGHQELMANQLKSIDRFDYIITSDVKKTEVYRERLHVGIALNNLLFEWRRNQ